MFDEHSTNLDNVIDLLFKLTIFINKSLEKLTYALVKTILVCPNHDTRPSI